MDGKSRVKIQSGGAGGVGVPCARRTTSLHTIVAERIEQEEEEAISCF